MFDQPSIDDREFWTEPSVCQHCGADLVDDAHERWCESSDDFFEPDLEPDLESDFGPEYEPEPPDPDFGLGE
jgi:hypothetical protein